MNYRLARTVKTTPYSKLLRFAKKENKDQCNLEKETTTRQIEQFKEQISGKNLKELARNMVESESESFGSRLKTTIISAVNQSIFYIIVLFATSKIFIPGFNKNIMQFYKEIKNGLGNVAKNIPANPCGVPIVVQQNVMDAVQQVIPVVQQVVKEVVNEVVAERHNVREEPAVQNTQARRVANNGPSSLQHSKNKRNANLVKRTVANTAGQNAQAARTNTPRGGLFANIRARRVANNGPSSPQHSKNKRNANLVKRTVANTAGQNAQAARSRPQLGGLFANITKGITLKPKNKRTLNPLLPTTTLTSNKNKSIDPQVLESLRNANKRKKRRAAVGSANSSSSEWNN